MWEEMVRKSWENGWSESRGKTDGQKVVGRDGQKVVGRDGQKVVESDGQKVVGRDGQKVVGRDGQLCAESRGISPDFQNE